MKNEPHIIFKRSAYGLAFADMSAVVWLMKNIKETVMSRNVNCKTFVEPGGFMPKYMTAGAACADVALPVDLFIGAKGKAKVPLNISFDIPKGFQIKMTPRSSLLVKYGLMSPESIIDADYKGIVHWPVVNLSDEPVKLECGTRVAQIELVPAYNCVSWERENKIRGEGGFGSTGAGHEISAN